MKLWLLLAVAALTTSAQRQCTDECKSTDCPTHCPAGVVIDECGCCVCGRQEGDLCTYETTAVVEGGTEDGVRSEWTIDDLRNDQRPGFAATMRLIGVDAGDSSDRPTWMRAVRFQEQKPEEKVVFDDLQTEQSAQKLQLRGDSAILEKDDDDIPELGSKGVFGKPVGTEEQPDAGGEAEYGSVRWFGVANNDKRPTSKESLLLDKPRAGRSIYDSWPTQRRMRSRMVMTPNGMRRVNYVDSTEVGEERTARKKRDVESLGEDIEEVEETQFPREKRQRYYDYVLGKCGDNLVCTKRTDIPQSTRPEDSESICRCRFQGTVCGSDKRTYDSLCSLAVHRVIFGAANLTLIKKGPCMGAPQVTVPPRDTTFTEGSNVVLSCEVEGYPLPSLFWQQILPDKPIMLPVADHRMSVNVRGGPEEHRISTWLQLQSADAGHDGSYQCVAENSMGRTEMVARLSYGGKPVSTNLEE